MHPPECLNRRHWLRAAGAALTLGTAGVRWAFAATPQARGKLVVVMLRGALDGLAAVPPVGDPHWSRLRSPGGEAPLGLDNTFALHPALAGLHRWYGEGQLLVVHAVASPYRERSHFDAQQVLESGGERPFALDTGWLGRALALGRSQGVALSPSMPLALRGTEQATTWTPSRRDAPEADFMARVARLYEGDDHLQRRWQQVQSQAMGPMEQPGDPMKMGMGGGGPGNAFATLATQAGRFLAEPGGPSVAWLDVNGWDTHTQQAPRLQRLLGALDAGLLSLRNSLGDTWADTTVLVMTEFGRSAAFNGSGGTDHGTGGVAFLAGGAVAGGRVLGDWPGLSSSALLDGRDLRPTTDVRSLQRALLQRHLGIGSAHLAQQVLPGAPPAMSGLWRS
ncbi:DUF1501 domain-containing protein [Hydrogenophaga sp.]|uniref:DUF1501 domain-containing protein n=1 Tax=Hydrogenophaga sp. TaxID=1904254 RepID=UPI003F724F20